MPDSSGGKLCPICDSPLQPGSRKCGFCGTDLSIFDMDMESSKKAPEPAPAPQERPSIHAKVEEVLSRPPPAPAPTVVREAPEPAPEPVVAAPSVAEPEPVVVQEPTPEPEPVKEPIKEPAPAPRAPPAAEYFECPQCGARVGTAANSCPKCGVLFAEEGADMFQCPACNTLVNIDAKSCPGCGAMFVEPESEQATGPAPEPVHEAAKPEAPVTVTEAAPPPEPKEPEPAEARAAQMKGFLGRLKFGRKEKPIEHTPEERPEPKPAPRHETLVLRELREAPPARPTPLPERAPAAQPRPSPQPTPGPVAKDKGKELARMVAEMKPLLALARERDVDIGQGKELIDEAALSGRERRLDRAIELVQQSKSVLMSRIDSHLSQTIGRLNEDMKVAREFGGDITRAAGYLQDLAQARSASDVEAAFVCVDKVEKELAPITGRYNEARKKMTGTKQFVTDCEQFQVDTKEARRLLGEAEKAFESRDFDRLDIHLRGIIDNLNKAIPPRMNEEMVKAKADLVEAKAARGANITPMLTVLKSATSLMKSGDYPQAIREMREFKSMMEKLE